jgi:hypothetical protein
MALRQDFNAYQVCALCPAEELLSLNIALERLAEANPERSQGG